MAVYKPTDCVPSGDSFDALNDRPIFIECKIDTNNAIVNGYSLELFDEDNNKLWSADSGTADYSVQQTDNITLIVDLKRFFDDKDIKNYFHSFKIEYIKEETMTRYKLEKKLYKVCLRNNK